MIYTNELWNAFNVNVPISQFNKRSLTCFCVPKVVFMYTLSQ